MDIAIDNKIYNQAQIYANQQGLNLSTIVEKFLLRFIGRSEIATTDSVPDIVLSLLGAGEPVADDDLNGRKAYNQYLEEKYK